MTDALVPPIDRYILPRRYGAPKEKEGAAST